MGIGAGLLRAFAGGCADTSVDGCFSILGGGLLSPVGTLSLSFSSRCTGAEVDDDCVAGCCCLVGCWR